MSYYKISYNNYKIRKTKRLTQFSANYLFTIVIYVNEIER